MLCFGHTGQIAVSCNLLGYVGRLSGEALTAALLKAADLEAIAAAAATHACEAFAAQACAVRLLNTSDATLDRLYSSGLTPATQERFRRMALTATNPVAAAARTGSPLFFSSLAELVGEYPQFAATLAALGLQAFAALALAFAARLWARSISPLPSLIPSMSRAARCWWL